MKKLSVVCMAVSLGLVLAGKPLFADSEHHSMHNAAPHDMKSAKGTEGKTKKTKAATYACPMHPEVTSNKPGKCPECGMKLKKAKAAPAAKNKAKAPAATYTCPMHPEVTGDKADKCPQCGMFLERTKAAAEKSEAKAPTYACPMHPEVKSDKAGKCPECGMFLEKSK